MNRLAGICYLLVAVLGGFAELGVRAGLRVPGDAAATAANIAGNTALFRAAFLADMAMAVCFLALGFLLHRLFRDVDRDLANVLVVLVAVGAGTVLVNLVFHATALQTAVAGADDVTLLLVDLHRNGYLIAGVLFGLWLLPLGRLVYTSGRFPRALGVLLMVSCACYLTNTVAVFAVPDLNEAFSTVVTLPTAVAEFWMIGCLLLPKRQPQPVPA